MTSKISSNDLKNIVSHAQSYKDIPEGLLPQVLKSMSLSSCLLEQESMTQLSLDDNYLNIFIQNCFENNISISNLNDSNFSLTLDFFSNKNFLTFFNLIKERNPLEAIDFILLHCLTNDRDNYISYFSNFFQSLPVDLQKDKELFYKIAQQNPILLTIPDSPFTYDESCHFLSEHMSRIFFTEETFSFLFNKFDAIYHNFDMFKHVCKTGEKKIVLYLNHYKIPEEWTRNPEFLDIYISSNSENFYYLSEDRKEIYLNYLLEQSIDEYQKKVSFLAPSSLPYSIRNNYEKINKFYKTFDDLSCLSFDVQNKILNNKVKHNFSFLKNEHDGNLQYINELLNTLPTEQKNSVYNEIIQHYQYLPAELKSDFNFNNRLLNSDEFSTQDISEQQKINIFTHLHPNLKLNQIFFNVIAKDNSSFLPILQILQDGNNITNQKTELIVNLCEKLFSKYNKVQKKILSRNLFKLLIFNNYFFQTIEQFKKDEKLPLLYTFSDSEAISIIDKFIIETIPNINKEVMEKDLKESKHISSAHKVKTKKF